MRFLPVFLGVFGFVAAVTASEKSGAANLLNWRKNTYEAKVPVLNKAPETSGLKGRVVPLIRIHGANAVGDESAKTLQLTAWKNERVSGQIVVWTKEALPQLRVKIGELADEDGRKIPAKAVQARFVRYVLAKGQPIGDILDTAECVDMPNNGYRPFWVTVTVPPKTRAGLYKAPIDVIGSGGVKISFNLELKVVDARLRDAEDWAFFLDLWQHPWAVARYHGVEPFSKMHYELLKPIYTELANAGQKTITATLTDTPWNHQNFDPYKTMIRHYRQKDGSWKHDYSLFDEYVEFAQDCGLGPQIHCYSMATWGDCVYFIDAETGDQCVEKLPAGTAEHERFWAPFLRDFQKHLKKQGWLGKTYIAMDERPPEQVAAVAKLVKENSPKIKITMAANQVASNFKDIEIDTFCVFLEHSMRPEFIEDTKRRKAEGKVSTFYVCCGPARPNTFTQSPIEESTWLGVFSAAVGFDGFLRWAFCNWPMMPLFDSSFGPWPAGDTFLVYPGMRHSVRWEALRDGIEEFEKIRLLREEEADMTKVDAALKKMRDEYGLVVKNTPGTVLSHIRGVSDAVNVTAGELAD